jgi:hypothetical protein
MSGRGRLDVDSMHVEIAIYTYELKRCVQRSAWRVKDQPFPVSHIYLVFESSTQWRPVAGR